MCYWKYNSWHRGFLPLHNVFCWLQKRALVVTEQKIPTNSYQWDVASQFCVFCLPQISDITFQWQKTCPKVLPGKLTHRFLENTHLSWQIPSKMVDAPSRFFWVYRWLTIKKLLFQSLISKRVVHTFTANITWRNAPKMRRRTDALCHALVVLFQVLRQLKNQWPHKS